MKEQLYRSACASTIWKRRNARKVLTLVSRSVGLREMRVRNMSKEWCGGGDYRNGLQLTLEKGVKASELSGSGEKTAVVRKRLLCGAGLCVAP